MTEQLNDVDFHKDGNSASIAIVVCLAGVASLYGLTLAPTVQAFDSAELTVGAYTLGLVHAPGYPLYLLLGYGLSRLPIGDVGLRLNLMSAVLAVLAVALLFLILYRENRSPLVSLSVAWLLAATPLFWSQAIRAEVYALHICLVAGILYLWRRAQSVDDKWAYLACFVLLGLGMANHLTTVLLWAALFLTALWEKRSVRALAVLGSAVAILLLGLLYLYLPLRAAAAPAIDYIHTYFDVDLTTLRGVAWMVSGRMFQSACYLGPDGGAVAREALRFWTLLGENFLGVGVIFGCLGWYRQRGHAPAWNRLLSLYFAANWFCFVAYHVVDKEVMFIPAYLVWTIWTAEGAVWVAVWVRSRLPRLSPRTATALVSAILLFAAGLGVVLNGPLVSLRHNRRAYDYAITLLEQAEPGAMIVSHWATASLLDYGQVVEGRRPDVTSFNVDFFALALQERYGALDGAAARAAWEAWLEGEMAARPLCFVAPLPALPEHYQWLERGDCWILTPERQLGPD